MLMVMLVIPCYCCEGVSEEVASQDKVSLLISLESRDEADASTQAGSRRNHLQHTH
jgi:hypothetical protein